MDEAEIARFGRLFGEFLTRVVEPARVGDSGRESIIDRLENFLGADPATLPVVTEEFRPFEPVHRCHRPRPGPPLAVRTDFGTVATV